MGRDAHAKMDAMKTVALLTIALACAGCTISRNVSRLIDPDVIKALAMDTNRVELTITAPTFGTLHYSRNMPAQSQ